MQRPIRYARIDDEPPAAGSSNLQTAKACYICGSTSHLKYNCPDRVKACHYCNSEDHLKYNCPDVLRRLRCYHCKELGHRMDGCEVLDNMFNDLCDPSGPDLIYNGEETGWGYEC